jgi:chemotaxis regulatin CheY-phosphate phosphatase CheZ
MKPWAVAQFEVVFVSLKVQRLMYVLSLSVQFAGKILSRVIRTGVITEKYESSTPSIGYRWDIFNNADLAMLPPRV